MVSRSWRSLTFLLLLVVAAPPPRVTNALIAATQHNDPAKARKPVQSRARNRVGSPILVTVDRAIAGIGRGLSKPARPSRPFSWRPDRTIAIRSVPDPAKLVLSAPLRC